MYGALLESYQQLQQEMAAVAAKWQECERRIDDYVDEQVRTSLRWLVLLVMTIGPISSHDNRKTNMNTIFADVGILSKYTLVTSVIVMFVIEAIEVLVQDVNM